MEKIADDPEKLKLEVNTEKFLEVVTRDIARMIGSASDIHNRDLIVALIPDQYQTGYGTMVVSVNGSPTRGQAIVRCASSEGSETAILHHYITYAADKVSRVKRFPKQGTYHVTNIEISLEALKKNELVHFCQCKLTKPLKQ